MKQQDYHAAFTVDVPAHEVFESINDVSKWWTGNLKGNSQNQGDEFTVQFDDVHVSTQRIAELIPDQKIVWLVTDSELNFIRDRQEWNNTMISFELLSLDNKTQVSFTHVGLTPAIECYHSCSKGWDYFFKGNLFKLLTEGRGTPGFD